MDWLFGAYMFRRLFRSVKNAIYLVLVLVILLVVVMAIFTPDLLEQVIRSVMGRIV